MHFQIERHVPLGELKSKNITGNKKIHSVNSCVDC